MFRKWFGDTFLFRRFSLRAHLVLLVLVVALPLIVFGAFMSLKNIEQQRAVVHQGMRDTARALSLAVDREIGTIRAVLETLADSQSLYTGDFESFHQLCVRAMENHRGSWLILFDATGQQLINTLRPYGATLPNPAKPPAGGSRHPDYPDLPVGLASAREETMMVRHDG